MSILRRILACGSRGGFLAVLMAAATVPGLSQAQIKPSAGMMQNPDVSRDAIVFSYANDLWLVDRSGGMARPVASPEGVERMPRFSPDGTQIAFSGNYEGGTDLYTIATSGGNAQRVTYHPSSELLCDWSPDGKSLIYSTNGFAGLGRQEQIFRIAAGGGLPEQLPVPYGSNAAINDDGQWLAYTPYSRDTRTWKRYRGGLASDIWLFHLKDHTSKQITDFDGTDSLPMWHGETVYYLSDAGPAHRLNIWSYNTRNGERQQVTKFTDFDCKWPSMGPGPQGEGEIVLSNGPQLYLVNLKQGQVSPVNITIPGDRPTLRPLQVDAAEFINGGDVSSTGKRVVLEARGDIWTAPVQNGSPRNLTDSSDSAERSPIWSPNGQWIAYLSDATGEYEVYVTQSDGRGKTRQLTTNGDCYRYLQNWSPDSRYLTLADKTGKLFLIDVETGDQTLVDTDPTASQITPSWSHNSQWLVYSRASDERSPSSSIWVFRVSDGTRKQLTADYFADSSPVFDTKGEHIFFHSNRDFSSPKYEDVGTTFIYSDTSVLMAMPLRQDVKYLLAAKIDEETWKKEGDSKESKDGAKDAEKQPAEDAAEKKDATEPSPEKADEKETGQEQASDDKAKSDEKDAPKPFEIEFEGIEARAFQLPVGSGNFGTLAVNDKNHLLFAKRGSRGSGAPSSIQILDLSADKLAAKPVVEGADNYTLSADRKKAMVFNGGKLYVIDAAAGQKLEKPVSTDNMTVRVDQRAQWRQILREAWRLERDFFYDPTMHGVDWDQVWQQYSPLLDDCVSRADVGFLIREMISELNVGHAYYRGQDVEDGPSSNTGLLGCSFVADGKAYKIAHLYEGGPWDYDARNPLRMMGVKEGQYLLQINGQDLTTEQSPYQMLQGTSGATVSLTVSDDAQLDDEDRRIAVETLRSESNLLFRDWIESKRKYVEEKTGGKVGYIYVVNTGVPGQNDLVRQLYAQFNKEALIIDDRWNGGGQIPTRFIELLNRPATNFWARRDGRDWTWPPDAHQGPKCMLINGPAGSGGDMFPALFRQNQLGKLIGKRTWGGLVGISGGPSLVDGASVTMPSFAYYELDGTWGIEGHGVDPDIEVVDDPALMVDGGDPQLDAAIKLMLESIQTQGFKAPPRPAYPDRSKFGIKPEDR